MCNLIKTGAWKLDILHILNLPFLAHKDNRLPTLHIPGEN